MQIIDNINGNHNRSIQKILSSASKMLLVSPFLTEDFEEFVHDAANLGVKEITLITTLRDNTTDLFKKANSLYSFRVACLMNKVNYDIRIDNKLHGKIYIAFRDNKPIKGIITSANFTVNGLSYSHEWGIEIDDTAKLLDIINDIYQNSTNPLSQKELDDIVKTIDEYLTANEPRHEPKPKLEVEKFIITNKPMTVQTDIRYFLKPVGSSDTPFATDRVFNRDIQELHFSKRKPVSVRPGDILICYGVGTTKLVGYFKVLTEPHRIPDDKERWPWRVDSENLCPDYSDKWNTFDNTLSSLQASYGKNEVLTYVGGKSLGALNFGGDKIQLNFEFARYIINAIEKSV